MAPFTLIYNIFLNVENFDFFLQTTTFCEGNGESFIMFQIILVFWLGIIKIMYLFDIGMFELGMVLLVFDFVYILKRLQFVCVSVSFFFSILSCSTSCGNKWTSCTKL